MKKDLSVGLVSAILVTAVVVGVGYAYYHLLPDQLISFGMRSAANPHPEMDDTSRFAAAAMWTLISIALFKITRLLVSVYCACRTVLRPR